MRHEFDAKLLAEPRAAELAQQAAALLDAESHGSVIRASAMWRLPTPGADPADGDRYGAERGRPLVEVAIHDPYGVDVVRWLGERDQTDRDLGWYVRRHWGDLLAAHSDEFVRRVIAERDVPTESASS